MPSNTSHSMPPTSPEPLPDMCSDDSPSDQGRRISEAAKVLGTRKSAAQVMGCSTDSLARYIRGDVEPPFSAMKRLAAASGKTLEWIAFGVSGKYCETKNHPATNRDDIHHGRHQRSLDVYAEATREVGYEPPTIIAEHVKSLLLWHRITADEIIPLLAALKSEHTQNNSA